MVGEIVDGTEEGEVVVVGVIVDGITVGDVGIDVGKDVGPGGMGLPHTQWTVNVSDETLPPPPSK